MGEGDPELGKKLLISFLKNLIKSEKKIDFIGCVNSGINLTTHSGDALKALEQLQNNGSIIASCGSCLDHYGKRDQLMIGQVGSMDKSVNLWFEADKIIQP